MSNTPLNLQDIQELINRHETLIIDAVALSHPEFEHIFDNILQPILKRAKKRILIPREIFDKIHDNKESQPYNEIYDKHLRVQQYITAGEDETSHILRDKQSVLAFIGDAKIGNQILKFKQHRALFIGKRDKSFRIFENKTQKSQTQRTKQTNISSEKITINGNIPTLYDEVYYKHNGIRASVTLAKEIASGGEGIIYATNSGFIAKIYKIDKDNRKLKVPSYTPPKLERLAKIKLIRFPEYVFLPLHILKNHNNETIGFLMNKADGKPIQYILGGSKGRAKHFPNITYKHLVRLCINFLKCICELHKKNVIVGDINTQNILFDTNCNIYFIDCDSYQIGGFPCPVTTEAFLHPAHRGKDMKNFMRNLADEYYAIAIFLFMLINLGRHPYDRKGGGRDDASKNMDFSYDINGPSNNAPNDLAKKRWERLSNELKECFYHSFQKGGKYASENKCLKPEIWLKHFEAFEKMQ